MNENTMGFPFSLRPMSAEDAAAAAEIERRCFSIPWSEAQLSESLASPLFRGFLCLAPDGRAAGYIGVQSIAGEAGVTNVATHPDFRRQGVARALLVRMIAALRAEGACSLTLEVRPSNEAALSLYRSEGFSPVGRRKNFYTDPTEDALLMNLLL